MNITRRACSVLVTGAVSLAAASLARARRQDVLTVLVAQPAGGITDAFARALAPSLGSRLGRLAITENIAGASGSLAAQRLLAAPRDGSTVLVASPSETVLAPLTLPSVRYEATDFRLLGLINNSPLAIYARGALEANDLDELVLLSRRAEGQPLSYGSTGTGGLFHLLTERLLSTTGAQATHVPYRGGMPMLTDLQSGVIDFALLPVDALLGQMVDTGRVKVLGVTSAQSLARFPAAAPLDKSKSAPHFGNPTIWVGLMAPAALNDACSRHLHQAVLATLEDAAVRGLVERAGGEVPLPMSMDGAARFYAAEASRLATLARREPMRPLK